MAPSEGLIEPVHWLAEVVCRAVPFPKRRQAELQGMSTSALRDLLIADRSVGALAELELQFLHEIATERKAAADPDAGELLALVAEAEAAPRKD
jgi:hypothetical protein